MEQTKALLRRLVEKREEKDAAALKAKAAEKEYKELEAEVYEHFEDEGIEGSLKFDLGGQLGTVRFNTRETYYGRILDHDAALEYFEDRCIVDEMTRPSIQKRRLNELVRELQEHGENMPPGIDFYANRGVTISRQKS